MISNEQVQQVTSQQPADKYAGIKFVHMKKDFFLNPDIENEPGLRFSIDGKTFNGKNYMKVRPSPKQNMRFDAVTVAYAPSQNGEYLDIAITFKNPKDVYKKSVGCGITSLALLQYQHEGEIIKGSWAMLEQYPNVYIASIEKDFILGWVGADSVASVLHTTKSVGIDEIRTYVLTQFVKECVVNFLRQTSGDFLV